VPSSFPVRGTSSPQIPLHARSRAFTGAPLRSRGWLAALARVWVVLFVSLSSSVFAAAGNPTAGIVVDASGLPLTRALVQIVNSDGAIAASMFTGAEGAFRFPDAPDGCRIQASLTGFEPAAADCRKNAPMRLTLRLAPVAEHIVVSATRTEAPTGQVASAVTVFDAAEIERRQQPLLADLLRDAPGAALVRTGAPGGVTSLFVRGGESNYTKVLLDGIPLNEPGGGFDFSNVTTEGLDRVEFVRGANSALYGSDAMTGVIQLFTRRGRRTTPEVHFAAEGGSFSTGRGSAGIAARAGRFDYSAEAAGLTTENDAPNDTFRNLTLSGSAGAALGRAQSLRFAARMERGHAGTPGQVAFGRPDLDAFYQRDSGVWGVSFDRTDGSVHQLASYGLSLLHQASTNLKIDPDYTPSFDGRTAPFAFSDFPYDSRSDFTRHHASYQVDGTFTARRAGTHVDTALLDWDGERATLRDALAGTSVPAARDNVGLTLQHQALWSRVFVTAGVRIEHNASFGNAAAPRLSAAWYVRTSTGTIGSTRISASAGRSIKEPTILQSFSASPFFLGNAALRPERARAFDVGVEQRLARDRVRFDLTWFDNRYRDIISTRTLSFDPFTAQYFNIGLTRARGAELSGDVALVAGLRAKAGYTFTDSEILESTSDSSVFEAGNWAFRRPRHAGFADVAWNGAGASIDLSASPIGRRVDSDFSSLEPPIDVDEAHAQLDLRALVRLTRQLSLTGAIDNLTDSQYMEPLGYPALGRAVRLGVRVRF
jgi:vitamin B12 transporter